MEEVCFVVPSNCPVAVDFCFVSRPFVARTGGVEDLTMKLKRVGISGKSLVNCLATDK